MEKYRCRNFNLVLYPDCAEHVSALERIKAGYDYACILHDKDFDVDGVVKKAHWHVVIVCQNAKWNTAIAKELGVDVNYVGQQVRGLDNVLLYLLHYNNPDKYQYPFDEVQGNLKTRIKALLNRDDKTECEKVIELIDYLESCNTYVTYHSFARYAAENGRWDVYRRASGIFNSIISEHNVKFSRGDFDRIDILANAIKQLSDKKILQIED